MSFRKSLLGLAAAAALIAGSAASSFGATWYVIQTATVGNDGRSWATASSDINGVVSSAAAGDEIWVARGNYKPGALSSNAFALKSGVSLYGGFAGGETSLSDRNVAANVTVLDGNGDNHHVVVADGVMGARLDGFTVTGGMANGSVVSGDRGAGIYIANSSPTVANCTISSNYGTMNGGVYVEGSAGNFAAPVFENCVLEENSSAISSSSPSSYGALYSYRANPTFKKTVFKGNRGDHVVYVGALATETVNGLFESCTFAGNVSARMIRMTNEVSFVNCTFHHNSGGRTFYLASGEAMNLINCTVTDNTTENYGVLQLTSDAAANVVNSIFWGNDKLFNVGTSARLNMLNCVYSEGRVGMDPSNVLSNPLLASLDVDLKAAVSVDDIYIYGVRSGSPAIGAGLAVGTVVGTSAVPATDQRGVSRPGTGKVTMGSLEFVAVAPSSVTVVPDSLNLDLFAVGETGQLEVLVTPSDNIFVDTSVVWSSSNSAYASVSSEGLVTALSADSTGRSSVTVTAASVKDPTKSGNAVVTVTQRATGVTLDKGSVEIRVGGSSDLTATVAPVNAYNKNVTWSSSDSSVVSVTAAGVVTGVSTGTANVTATTVDGAYVASATVRVHSFSSEPNPAPTLPVGTPSNVRGVESTYTYIPSGTPAEDVASVIGDLAGLMSGVGAADLVSDSNGYVRFTEEALNGGLEAGGFKVVNYAAITAMPVFQASVANGQVAAVSFPVSGRVFGTDVPSHVKVVKVLSSSLSKAFTYTNDPSKFGDMMFTVLNYDNSTISSSINYSENYKVVVFIKDGGTFDLDRTVNGTVIDPVAILKIGEVYDGEVHDSNCNAGFGLAALLGLIPVVAWRRRR